MSESIQKCAKESICFKIGFNNDNIGCGAPVGSRKGRARTHFIRQGKPRQYQHDIAGNGTSQQLFGEVFKLMASVDMVHVPYRRGAPALTDLLAGQVQVMFDFVITSGEHIRIRSRSAGPLSDSVVTRRRRGRPLCIAITFC
jgi:hypothetical protein